MPWLVLLTAGSAGKAGIVALCAGVPATGVYLLVTLVPVAFPLHRQMTGPRPVRP